MFVVVGLVVGAADAARHVDGAVGGGGGASVGSRLAHIGRALSCAALIDQVIDAQLPDWWECLRCWVALCSVFVSD